MSEQATDVIPSLTPSWRARLCRAALAQVGFPWTRVSWRRGGMWRGSDCSGRFLAVPYSAFQLDGTR
jgi:hypothetical protein